MITILVVGSRETLMQLSEPDPSVELVTAAGLEDALERLARNRRIDAVLLLPGAEAPGALARAILEEDPVGPPLFAPAGAGAIPAVRTLPDGPPEDLVAEIARRLER